MNTNSTVRRNGSHPTLYDLLEVAPRATEPVIHAAYRVLARSYHPDHNHSESAEALMRQLNAAYAVLSDERRRARYDAHLARSGRLPSQNAQPLAPYAVRQVRPSRVDSQPPVATIVVAPRLPGITAAVLILAILALLTGLLWLVFDSAVEPSQFGAFGLSPTAWSQPGLN